MSRLAYDFTLKRLYRPFYAISSTCAKLTYLLRKTYVQSTEKVSKGSYTCNRKTRSTQLLYIQPGGGCHDRPHRSHWPDRPSSAEQPARERRADPRDRTRSLPPSRTHPRAR